MVVTPANTTITTTLSASSITAGSSVYDTATLFGATPGAGGSVTYEYFAGRNCSGGAAVVSTVTVTGGSVPPSASQSFGVPGAYGWEAIYSGDANNVGSVSACEPLNVAARANVTITTNLSASTIPVGGAVHDTSLLFGATATAGGSVTYEHFASADCTGNPTVVSVVPVRTGSFRTPRA